MDEYGVLAEYLQFNGVNLMKNKYLVFVLFVLLCIGGGQALADGSPNNSNAFVPHVLYTFAPVPEGAKILHVFVIKNKGNALLHIDRVKTG